MRSTGVSELDETVKHIPKFGGHLWFVDASIAVSGDGTTPDGAFKTILEATTASAAGDAINVSSGVYVEDVVLSKDSVEVWCENGAVIDGTGTCLTISGNYCRVNKSNEHLLVITPAADQIGVAVTGTGCLCTNVTVTGSLSDHGWYVTGDTSEFRNCRSTGVKAASASFYIKASNCKLVLCDTSGDSILATYGYYFDGTVPISQCSLIDCSSAGHVQAGFYLGTGVSVTTLLGCSSGGGDGKWRDIDSVNAWDAFSFDNIIYKSIDIAQVGGGTYNYNIFKITGIVRINSIEGHTATALTGSNTACYLNFYSTNGSAVITKATGTVVGAALEGSFLGRIDDDGVALAFSNAAGPGMIDAVYTSNQAFRLIEDRTGGAHVASYIRFTHTTAGASSGTIHWHVDWEPISPDGMVTMA